MSRALALHLILISSAFVCFKAYAYPQKNTHDYYGLNFQHFKVQEIYNDSSNVREVGNSANAVGFFYKSIIDKYLHLELGTDYVMLKDKNPFTETIQNGNGNTVEKKSSVYGYSIYLEGGIASAFVAQNPFNLGASLGFRYNDINRSIFRCSSCQEVKVSNIKNDFYVKTFIEYTFSSGGIAQLYSTVYRNEQGFENGVGLRLAAPLPY